MKHKKCGGLLVLDGDCYRCTKCKIGFKCVGAEQYLRDVIE